MRDCGVCHASRLWRSKPKNDLKVKRVIIRNKSSLF